MRTTRQDIGTFLDVALESSFGSMLPVGVAVIIGVSLWFALRPADTSRAESALETAGYSSVELFEDFRHSWTCGEDAYAVHFSAKGPTGKPALGVVCCGALKSCTIRL